VDIPSQLERRFWARVVKTDRCWLWQGALSAGYGAIVVRGQRVRAHRLAWQLTHGAAAGSIRHCCHRKNCVRPDHLYVAADRADEPAARPAEKPERAELRLWLQFAAGHERRPIAAWVKPPHFGERIEVLARGEALLDGSIALLCRRGRGDVVVAAGSRLQIAAAQERLGAAAARYEVVDVPIIHPGDV
jgi:hypothetical protein